MKRSCESPSIPPSDPSPSETALAPEPQPGGGDGAGGDAETALAPEPQHWPERHRRGIDLAVVALVLAYNQLVLPVPAQGPVPWLLEALCPGLALAYLLRRRRPLTAFAVMLLLTWAQLLAAPLGGFLPVDLLLGLMVHHLANTRRRAVSLTAAALVMAWVPIAFAPALRMGYSRLSLPGLVMIAVAWAWTTGALRRARRDRLAALVEEVFEYARLSDDAGEDDGARMARVELVEEVVQCLLGLAGPLEAAGLEVELRAPDALVAETDPGALRRIVANLVRNAVQHGRGRLRVELAGIAGRVRLRMRNGVRRPGALDISRALERGWSSDPAGTGLGLSIVELLAARLGGSVAVGLEGEEFEVVLELPATPPAG